MLLQCTENSNKHATCPLCGCLLTPWRLYIDNLVRRYCVSSECSYREARTVCVQFAQRTTAGNSTIQI